MILRGPRVGTPRTRRIPAIALAFALLASACSGDPESTATDSFTLTPDLLYLTLDGSELRMDVYAPVGEGPWPVVVAFHGLSSAGKDADSNSVVAAAAAAQGMIVFAPSWTAGDPFPLTIEDVDRSRKAATCAVAFAQELAAKQGGEPSVTVAYGFSAGTEPAILASLAPMRDSIAGCETDATPIPVKGVVLGDGEYFFHSENFDGAFRDDLEAMQTAVRVQTDPASWPASLDATFSIWAAEEGTAPRSIDDPWDESGWLAARDPDGSIRRDLQRLGQLDDGIISYLDSARLLELRLATAGIDVTLNEYPGGHDTVGKVPELVAALQAAATE